MPHEQPLNLNAIEVRAAAATPGPWEVELDQCDCSDGLCSHGTYVRAVYANGERRTDFVDFPDADWQFVIRARTAVPAMAAEIRGLRAEVAKLVRWHTEDGDALAEMRATIVRLRAELAEYEVLNPQQCPAGRHADWLVDSEYAHACPWCEIERLKAEPAADAVRALHQPMSRAGFLICAHCSGWNGFRCLGLVRDYPCDTIRALDGEQAGEAQQDPGPCGAREPEPRTGTSPCVLPAGHGGTKHQDKWTNQWPTTVARSGQPDTDEEALVHVGWWCWRGDNHGHLATMACRSDNVPVHVPAEWADDMRAVLQRIEDGDEPDTDEEA